MKQSIYDYMKLGTISFMSYPVLTHGVGDEILPTLKKLATDPYFTAIEVTWIKDPAVRKKAAEIFAQSGIKVCYGAQPRLLTTGYNINDLNPKKRTLALNSLLEGLHEAKELGAKGMAFLSGPYCEETKEESFAALVSSTRTLCAEAEKLGMTVELEVFDYDVDKKV